MGFNLLDEHFIRYSRLDGRLDSDGVRKVVTEAHTIRELSFASPQDNFAVYRFLLVALHSIGAKAPTGEATHFSDAIVEQVDTQCRAYFDLFDSQHPFGQVVNNEVFARPVGDLLAEVPADTNINHFRHAYDSDAVLCPSCCALGLLRLAGFCTQGGQGKAPSLNGVPPLYVMPQGTTLFDTLRMGLGSFAKVSGDKPAWLGTRKTKLIGPLEGFTWMPRAVRLPQPHESTKPCGGCGVTDATGWRVGPKIVFAKGRPRPSADRTWLEPHGIQQRTGKKIAPITAPEAVAQPVPTNRLWRREVRGVLVSLLPGEQDIVVPALARLRLASPTSEIVARGCNYATRQNKSLHDTEVIWPIAPEVRSQAVVVERLLGELKWLDKAWSDFECSLTKKITDQHANNRDQFASLFQSWMSNDISELEFSFERAFRSLLSNPTSTAEFRQDVRNAVLASVLTACCRRMPILERQRFDHMFAELMQKHFQSCQPVGRGGYGGNQFNTSRPLYIARLAKLSGTDLARLQRSSLLGLESNAQGFDRLTDIYWPLREQIPKRPALLVARLFAWHPSGGGRGNLGAALRTVAAKLETTKRTAATKQKARERIDSAFSRLLEVGDLTDAAPLLLALVKEIARGRVRMDWLSLLTDLCDWDSPGREIQQRWATSYLEGELSC